MPAPTPTSRFPRSESRPVREAGNPRSGDADAWSDEIPNPFSLVMQAHEPSARSRFVRAVKTMAVTLALTAVLLAAFFFGKQVLLARLLADFDDLDPAAQHARLVQIASFGVAAIQPLVTKLADDRDEVSESAFTLLRQMQKDWLTLSPQTAVGTHAKMIAAIDLTFCAPGATRSEENSAARSKQLARARELVRQTILEFPPPAHREMSTATDVQQLLASTNRLLADLEGKAASTAIVVSAGGELDPLGDLSDASGASRRSGWTDWPPPPQSASAQIIRSGSRLEIAADGEIRNEIRSDSDSATSDDLQLLPEGETAPLSQLAPNLPEHQESVVAARRPVGRVIQMSTHVVDSPLAALNDETVIRHLANPDAIWAERARGELIQRGFSEVQLETATALAVASPEDRIRLIDALVHKSGLDSGPWLSMLLDDSDRRVRLHVAAALAQSQDAVIVQRLRERLAREEDAHVAARLRRILGYR